ncbi:hypothetical protein P8452_56852 [Trifolium repens]|nr:hypothetical protein P8452_56852 [Trifolium repens]
MQQQLLNSLGEYQLAVASATDLDTKFCRFGSNPPLLQHLKRSQPSQSHILDDNHTHAVTEGVRMEVQVLGLEEKEKNGID